MTTPQEKLKDTVKAAIDLSIGTLPKSDKVIVLAEQIAKISETLTPEERRVLNNVLSSGKSDAPARELTQPQSAKLNKPELGRRGDFLTKIEPEMGLSWITMPYSDPSRSPNAEAKQQQAFLTGVQSSAKPDAAAPGDLTQPQSVIAQRDAFLEKYKISELGSSQVALTLPAGTTRIEFLKEAQALSIALRESNPEKYQADQAVDLSRLESWKSERRFSEAIESDLSLTIDGNVKGSTDHTHKEQVNKAWNDVALKDLAVAHTAFYLLTGKNLFEGNIVRAADGALDFRSRGLDVPNFSRAVSRELNVSASRSLPVQN